MLVVFGLLDLGGFATALGSVVVRAWLADIAYPAKLGAVLRGGRAVATLSGDLAA